MSGMGASLNQVKSQFIEVTYKMLGRYPVLGECAAYLFRGKLWKWKWQIPPKYWYLHNLLQDVTFQKGLIVSLCYFLTSWGDTDVLYL